MPYPFDQLVGGNNQIGGPPGAQPMRPLMGPGPGVGQPAMQAPVQQQNWAQNFNQGGPQLQGFAPRVPGLVNNYQQVLGQGHPGGGNYAGGPQQGWAGGYLGAPGVQGGFGAIMKGNQFDPNRLQGLLQDRTPQGMAGTLNGLGGGYRGFS